MLDKIIGNERINIKLIPIRMHSTEILRLRSVKNLSVKNLNLFSLEGPIKLAFHKGCEIEVFNGPILETIP
jgi:hypothetical protein